MKTLEEIKQKVRDFSGEIIPEVNELCNSLPYIDGSNVSFIVDYVRRLLNEVESIELRGK
jgi:hypothetical protein